jgi:mannitol-specific phosphotransferase system IIBC component
VFGPDGRLHLAALYGPASVPFSEKRGCQRVRQGKAVVRFTSPTYPGSGVLRIAYLAATVVNGDDVTVSYGGSAQVLTVKAGLHAAYFPVRGSARSVTVSGIYGTAVTGLCVGAMQAGIIVPASAGPVIPAS